MKAIRILSIIVLIAGAVMLLASFILLSCGCMAVIPQYDANGKLIRDSDNHPVVKVNPTYIEHMRVRDTWAVVSLCVMGAGIAGILLTWKRKSAAGNEA